LYETVIGHNTALYHQVSNGTLPAEEDPAVLAKNYLHASEMLAAAGFDQKNLYAWDRPGYQNIILGNASQLKGGSQHLVGAGLSAYSVINGRPFFNETSKDGYVKQVAAKGYGARWWWAGEGEDMNRFMVMSPQDLQFDRAQFRHLFGKEIEEPFGNQLLWLSKRGLVERFTESYKLTRLGRAWAATIATQFYSWQAVRKIIKSAINCRLIPMTDEEAYQLPLYTLFHPEHVLSGCRDPSLLLAYIKTLRKANPRWLRTLFRGASRMAGKYGLPAFRWHFAFGARQLTVALRSAFHAGRRA
jgi:hypothetical protein